MSRVRLFHLYVWTIIPVGAAVCVMALSTQQFALLNIQFLLLALLTATVSSRISVPIPGLTSTITVSDTFIFLTILLYGGGPATLVAAAEGLCSASRISKKPRTLLFNAAAMAIATYLSGQVWEVYNRTAGGQGYLTFTLNYLLTLCAMVLVQYAVNSGLASVYDSLRSAETLWTTWRQNYLWTSITYVAGASGAAFTAKLITSQGFLAIVIAAPIIGIIYFTYRTYLKNLQSAKAQAEQARAHVEELNRYIETQQRIQEQFSQKEKMSALGELASGVAHDFNNCLAGILGRAELMMMQTDDPKMKRGLDIILKASQDGARTVKRIQDFARQRRARDFEMVAIDQMLADVSEMTRPRWKNQAEANDIHINLELNALSNACVMGDISELRDVLVNMIFNAVDAMPQGGVLTLSSSVVDHTVMISIGDTGTGMSEEVRSRVFNPFFTTKGVSGMGLGLAVGYGVINRHNGTIQVQSEIGKGTTFQIELPLAQVLAVAPQTQSEAVQAKRARLNMTKLLVVDDEERVRQLLREMLEAAGFDITLAETAPEALEIFEKSEFDGVFTDIGLPGMNGWELCRAIRAIDADIPLAVITGWGEAISDEDKRAAKADWVLTKPFSMADIMGLADEITRRKKTPVEPVALTVVAA
jgi:signal transduction histidine kinase/CheY-like chemotaxis protein